MNDLDLVFFRGVRFMMPVLVVMVGVIRVSCLRQWPGFTAFMEMVMPGEVE